MKRRDFAKTLGGALVAVPAVALIGCDDDDDDDDDDLSNVDATPEVDAAQNPPDASPGQPDAAGLTCQESIATNHGHTVQVPEADVLAGNEQTYTLTVGGDHTHMLTLTANHMATLAGGGSVTVESSIDGSASFGTHAHNVTVMCAS